jgi:hypothetical protein
MDTLYPELFFSYGKALDDKPFLGDPLNNELLSSYTELYVYGSTVVGIVILIVIACRAEPRRFYRTLKRRNTDESPLIQV